MAKARVILDQRFDVSDRYRVEIKVFKVAGDRKHVYGIKTSFVLIDVIEKAPRLLVDNHAPYGFHVHSELPGNKSVRTALNAENYLQALDEFWRRTKEIIDGES